MEVDQNAPVIADAAVEIAAAPEVVWEAVADLKGWPAWNPEVKTMSLDGPVANELAGRPCFQPAHWGRGCGPMRAGESNS